MYLPTNCLPSPFPFDHVFTLILNPHSYVPFIDSNDELFGGSAEYVTELGELLNTCMTEILKQLNGLGNYVPVSTEQGSSLSNASAAAATATAKLSQVRCVLHLVNQLGARFELASPAVAGFVVKLLELVQQTIATTSTGGNNNVATRNVGLTKADQKHFTNTLSYLKTRATMAPAGDVLTPSMCHSPYNLSMYPHFMGIINRPYQYTLCLPPSPPL